MQALLRKIRQILKDRRIRRFFTRVVSSVAAIVVFITTYALILPAITLERTAACGVEEHQHNDSCYEDRLVCGQEESDGHHHDDSCYSISSELICRIQEHQHSAENGCYDADGNLVCQLQEHVHDDSCYKEVRTLTCGLEESEGHQHTNACYKKVLICGKEVHTHSAACYQDTGENSDQESESGNAANPAASENPGADSAAAENNTSELTDSDNAATAETVLPGQEVTTPELAPLDFTTILNKDTGVYYYSVKPEEKIEDSSKITDWTRAKDKNDNADDFTELASEDLIRVYLAYTVPAGSLNTTNPTARYRLPDSIRLSDKQIEAINKAENGISSQYDDKDKHDAALGAEAIEGTRRPDQDIDEYLRKNSEDGQEYINATVKAENVFNDKTGEYEGQDLIFTFTPYTIEKNQVVYDTSGEMTKSGENVRGWFTFDMTTDQVEWGEAVVSSIKTGEETEGESEEAEDIETENVEVDNTAEQADEGTGAEAEENPDKEKTTDEQETAEDTEQEKTSAEETTTSGNKGSSSVIERSERSADIVFVKEGYDVDNNRIEEIATTLKLVEEKEVENSLEDDSDSSNDDTASDFAAGTLEASGEGYKITMEYTAEAQVPENASLSVREITAETDPEAYKECLEQAGKKMASEDSDDANDKRAAIDETASRFFDIEIVVPEIDENGQETSRKIEPKAEVSVNIQMTDTVKKASDNSAQNTKENDKASGSENQGAQEPTVLHFTDDGVEKLQSTVVDDKNSTSGDQVEDREKKDSETAEDTDSAGSKNGSTEIQFTTDSFSIYGVVYTVDFHWEVDGKKYVVRMPGGGFMSFEKLMEVLGVATNDKNTESETEDKNPEEATDIKPAEELELDDVEVSEETKRFVADVENIEFSTPEYVWVGKVEEDSTVGELKKENSLDVQLSAELTDEQIEEIDNTLVESGDWALISIQPFLSKETLTVSMKDGEVFIIQVTDDTSSDPLGLSGETFVVTSVRINYDNQGHEIGRSYPAALQANTGRLILQSGNISADANRKWVFEYDEEAFEGAGGYFIYCVINETPYYINATDGQLSLTTTKTLPEGQEPDDSIKLASPFTIIYDTNTMTYRISASENGNNSFLTFDNNSIKLDDTASTNNQLAFRNPDSPSNTPGTVGTWDIQKDNIVLKLFDYDGKTARWQSTGGWSGYWTDTNNSIDSQWAPDNLDVLRQGSGINNGRSLLFSGSGISGSGEAFNNFTGSRPNNTGFYSGLAYQNIVMHNLDADGFPVLSSDCRTGSRDQNSNNGHAAGSLGYLFDNNPISDGNAKKVYVGDTRDDGTVTGLKGLLRKDSEGYYYYDSEQNYARFIENKNEIILYSDTYRKGGGSSDVKTEKIGLFPFDDYNSNNIEEKTPQGGKYHHQFGMTIGTDFVYPKDGIVPETGHPMTFEFSGDDDVWVFVDGVLVLDLGGVHQPISGKIDFSTGDVKITEFGSDGNEYESDKSTTIKEMFKLASREKYGNDTSLTFNDDDFSQHHLDFFYLERGGCDSNCKIKFNLLMMTTVAMAKQVNGLTPAERQKYLNDEFHFELGMNHTDHGINMHETHDAYWANPAWRENFDAYNTEKATVDEEENFTVKTDKDGTQTLGVPISNGEFTLKDGEEMTVTHVPRSEILYLSEKDLPVLQQFEAPHAERLYENVTDAQTHEEECTLHAGSAKGDNNAVWETRAYKAGETDKLTFTNTIREKNLTVKKIWQDSKSQNDHPAVQFKLLATVEGEPYSMASAGYDSINAQWTETKNGVTTTQTEDVYVNSAEGKKFTLSKDNGWEIDFEHLPFNTNSVNDTGKEIIYSVQEIVPDEYSVSYNGPEYTNEVYLDLFKLWPDGNANHDGSVDEKPAEDIYTYVRRNDGMYLKAVQDTNGEYVYSEVTENVDEATPFKLTSKTRLSNNLTTTDQKEMFDYAARINGVPRTNGAEENPVEYSYYIDQQTDEDPKTTGLVMFTRPNQKAEILNTKGQIHVEKEWLDDKDQPLEDHPNHINYTVYRLRHDHQWAVYNAETKEWDYSQAAQGDGWYTVSAPYYDQDTHQVVDGLEKRVCRFASCNHYTEERTKVLDPCAEHDWTEWKVTIQPTCTAPGEETRICTECFQTETRSIKPIPHPYEEEVTPATCEAEGEKVYTCPICGVTYSVVIPALGHDWTDWVREGNKETCYCRNNPEHRQERNVNDVYPGTTDLYLVKQSDVWPTWEPHGSGENWKNDTKQVKHSGIFKYGNEYYVIISDGTVNYYQWPENPAELQNYIVKVNGQPPKNAQNIYWRDGKKYSWLNTSGQISKGDVLKEGDKYYVRTSTDVWSGPPSESMSGWYEVPPYEASVNGGRAMTLSAPAAPATSSRLAKGAGETGDPNDENGETTTGEGHGPSRGIPARKDLTQPLLLSALNLTGLDAYNEHTGDTLTLYKRGTLDTTTQTLVQGETNLWRNTEDVPLTDENGSEYHYYVVEDDPPANVKDGYDISYSGQDDGLTNGETVKITNKKKPKITDVTLKKVDKDDVGVSNPPLLNGASFTISKYPEKGAQGKDTSWGDNGSKTLRDIKGDDGYSLGGVFKFEELTEGYYVIEEIDFPTGYIKLSQNPAFSVLPDSTSGELKIVLDESTIEDGLVRLVDGELTIIVGNTPGAALPNTGGPGTQLFTILGSILILGVEVLLWRRRRLI